MTCDAHPWNRVRKKREENMPKVVLFIVGAVICVGPTRTKEGRGNAWRLPAKVAKKLNEYRDV